MCQPAHLQLEDVPGGAEKGLRGVLLPPGGHTLSLSNSSLITSHLLAELHTVVHSVEVKCSSDGLRLRTDLRSLISGH